MHDRTAGPDVSGDGDDVVGTPAARNFDSILMQWVGWLKSLDSDALVARIRSDLSLENLTFWHELLRQIQSYENRLDDLRLRSESQIEAESKRSSNVVGSEEQLFALRRQLFSSIPENVWSEAIEGFGDPDLANV